jgi:hypothetical protein
MGAVGLMLPDGTINPGKMTSFNHDALGAIEASIVGEGHHRVTGWVRKPTES